MALKDLENKSKKDIRLEIKSSMDLEKKRKKDIMLEKKSLADLEKKNRKDIRLEKKSLADLEKKRKKDTKLEKKSLAVLEKKRKKDAWLVKKSLIDLERKKKKDAWLVKKSLIDSERRREKDIRLEKKSLIDLEKKKRKDIRLEKKSLIDLEKRRKKDIRLEKKSLINLEKKKRRDIRLEKKSLIDLEKKERKDTRLKRKFLVDSENKSKHEERKKKKDIRVQKKLITDEEKKKRKDTRIENKLIKREERKEKKYIRAKRKLLMDEEKIEKIKWLEYENDIDNIYDEEDFSEYVRKKNTKIYAELDEAHKKAFNTAIDDEGGGGVSNKTVDNDASLKKEVGMKSNLEKDVYNNIKVVRKPNNMDVEINFSKIFEEHHSNNKKQPADASFFRMTKVIPFRDAIYEDRSISAEFRKRQLDKKSARESFIKKLKFCIKVFKKNKKVFKRFKKEKADDIRAQKRAEKIGRRQDRKIKKKIKEENDRIAGKVKKKYHKFKGFKKSSVIGRGLKKCDYKKGYKKNKKEKLNWKEVEEVPFFPNTWLPSNPPGWVDGEGLPKVKKVSTAEELEEELNRWLYFYNLGWEYNLYKQERKRAITISIRGAFLEKISMGKIKIARKGKLLFKNLLSLDLEYFYRPLNV